MASPTILVVPAILLLSASVDGGVIPSSMLISGNWSDPANWSSNPAFPNNGAPDPDSTYSATMTNKSATLDVDVVVTDFSMAHSSGQTNVLTNPSETPRQLVVEGLFAYRQGIISGNTTLRIGPGGAMNFLSTPAGQAKQLNAALVNEGTVTIDFLTNFQSTGPGSKIVNAPGGTMNVNNGLTLSKLAGSVDPLVRNEPLATINVPGSATVNWRLENDGLVNASGNVTLNGGGEHEGEFAIAPNRSVTFGGAGQTHTLLEDSAISGGGTATFSSTVNVHTAPENYGVAKTQVNPGGFVSYFGPPEGDPHSLDQLDMIGGTLSGEALDVALLNWLGGLIDVLNLFIAEDGFWTVPPFSAIEPRSFAGLIHNEGQASLKGVFTAVCPESAADGPEPDCGVINSGTIVATDNLSLLGEGTLENGGLLKASPDKTVSIDWRTTFTDNSQLEVTPGAAIFVLKAKLIKGFLKVDENGRLDLVNDDGQKALQMALTGVAMTSNGAVNFLGGSLGLQEPVLVDEDSLLKGSGRFTADGKFVFNNQTSPGNSPGTLTIEAEELEMGPTHRLEMEYGAPGSAEVDLLVVEGDLVLDGSLVVTAVDGFGPGEHLVIACTGSIVDRGLEIARFPAGFAGELVVDHLAGEVRLVVTAAGTPCPADLDGDGTVGGADLGLLLGSFGAAGPADFDGSGTVDSADLGTLLAAWGPC